jgi:hypothetical protein
VSGGNPHLVEEGLALALAGRVIVVIVQANLSGGKNLGLAQERVQLRQRGLIGELRLVGMNAGSREDTRQVRPTGVTPRQIESAVHRFRSFADADRENGVDSLRPGASEELVTVLVVPRTVQMRVGIDQGFASAA